MAANAKTKNTPLAVVICPECGAERIQSTTSKYLVCPNGHGKLWRKTHGWRVAQAEYSRQKQLASLPQATPILTFSGKKSGRYRLTGHPGEWRMCAKEYDVTVHGVLDGRICRFRLHGAKPEIKS